MKAIHRGKVLAADLAAMGTKSPELARQLYVPARVLAGVGEGRNTISGDMALQLAL